MITTPVFRFSPDRPLLLAQAIPASLRTEDYAWLRWTWKESGLDLVRLRDEDVLDWLPGQIERPDDGSVILPVGFCYNPETHALAQVIPAEARLRDKSVTHVSWTIDDEQGATVELLRQDQVQGWSPVYLPGEC